MKALQNNPPRWKRGLDAWRTRVRVAMVRTGWTNSELAEALDTSPSQLSRASNLHGNYATLRDQISAILGVSKQ